MNKILIPLLLLLSFSSGNAQTTSSVADWKLEAGPMLTVPIRYMHYFTVFGIGVDAAADHVIIDKLYGGARLNYAFFFGQGSVEGEESNINLFNSMGDLYYLFDFNMLIGFSGGLGLAFNSTGSDANFSRVFSLGYLVNNDKNDFVITAFFDQTNYQKNIGVRCAIRIPLARIADSK